jgi:hypothetical protein
MRRNLVCPVVLGLALFIVPGQIDCSKTGESCMSKVRCPHSDDSVSMSRTFSYGKQTMTSWT